MTSVAKIAQQDDAAAAWQPVEDTGDRTATILKFDTGVKASRVSKRQIVSFYLHAGMNAVIRTLRAWYRRRVVMRMLAMDDRQLSDIGLYRSDIYDALSVGLSEDPSMELTRRRLEHRGGERARRAEIRRYVGRTPSRH